MNKLPQGDELTHTSAEQLDGAIRYLTELTKKALHRRANAANNQGTLQQKPSKCLKIWEFFYYLKHFF
jgi:hypothetical protein